jgi:outer membrane receptor protein involved in Fe transport
VSGEYFYQSGGIQDVTIDSNGFEPLALKHVLNLRAGIDYRNLELAAYGNNVTDDEYFDFKKPTSIRWGPRSSWGLQLRYRW